MARKGGLRRRVAGISSPYVDPRMLSQPITLTLHGAPQVVYDPLACEWEPVGAGKRNEEALALACERAEAAEAELRVMEEKFETLLEIATRAEVDAMAAAGTAQHGRR